jgi:hypothetical protein
MRGLKPALLLRRIEGQSPCSARLYLINIRLVAFGWLLQGAGLWQRTAKWMHTARRFFVHSFIVHPSTASGRFLFRARAIYEGSKTESFLARVWRFEARFQLPDGSVRPRPCYVMAESESEAAAALQRRAEIKDFRSGIPLTDSEARSALRAMPLRGEVICT